MFYLTYRKEKYINKNSIDLWVKIQVNSTNFYFFIIFIIFSSE